MTFFRIFVMCLSLLVLTPAQGEEDIYTKKLVAKIDLAAQRMHVVVDGFHEHEWKISSGRSGFLTPAGTFSPKFLHRMHYSRQYNNAPMPYSVFFHRGYAVHGTEYVRKLGRPASHGCVRLSRKNAKIFFNLIKLNGKAQTEIILTGKAPRTTRYAKKKKRKLRKTRKANKRRKIARSKRKNARIQSKRAYRLRKSNREQFTRRRRLGVINR